ncbi:MAG: hypothetical protein ACK40A_18410, partial [Pannonibacter indicus]
LAQWLAADVSGSDSGAADVALVLAVFHTLFNCMGLILIWPLTGKLVTWLEHRFVNAQEKIGRPQFLDPTLRPVPQLALRGLLLETDRLSAITHAFARDCLAEPRVVTGELDARLTGSLALGRAIRSFIEHMNKEAMPQAVSEAIPDIIRGVQHLEEVAQFSAAALSDAALEPEGEVRQDVERMRQSALKALISGLPSEETPVPTELLEAAVTETETLYQLTKASLLSRASLAGEHVETIERSLLQIQQMRRCVRASWKAHRRLDRWFLDLKRDGASRVTGRASD